MVIMAECKYVFLGCDGVLIKGDSWPKLHKAAGLPEETDREWYRDYYSGKIDYLEWNKRVADFYLEKEVNRTLVEKVLFDYKLLEGARSTINRISNMNMPMAVLSTGIDLLVNKVCNDLGIKIWRTNTQMLFDKDGRFEKIINEYSDDKCKVIYLEEICLQEGIKPEEVMFVGNSVVDIDVFKLTNHGVIVGSKNPELGKYAWKQIDKLEEVVRLLGRQ